ncbi:DUF1697 domain-containing protein [Streptomyces meridianus]|uniref:DUF1697 domain-containing protein n=1 Tax=Streptomyces meridianus TaxID=2938945 RepID=A0ABT0X309_9ACTN|nr:DUF1697 domain-containing protein [Streptomyces meridianus]MCM2576908.1 DUF1697 domain-containing protein [Streptomyces meridianus]
MTTYAAFLRGVNVGGHNKVPMAALRDLLSGLGYADVRTLLQSGNAVFTSTGTDASAIALELERAVADRFGFDVRCTVRTAAELRAVADRCPFRPDGHDPAKLTVTFLAGPADPTTWDRIDPAAYGPDEFRLGEREIYAYTPGGLGRSKLMPVIDRTGRNLGATTRNWNTVTKLIAMAGDG